MKEYSTISQSITNNALVVTEGYQFAALLHWTTPFGPCLIAQHLVSRQKAIVRLSVAKPCSSHAHGLDQIQVRHLVRHSFSIIAKRSLPVIGLDAANVVWLTLQQLGHEIVHVVLELKTHSKRTHTHTHTERERERKRGERRLNQIA